MLIVNKLLQFFIKLCRKINNCYELGTIFRWKSYVRYIYFEKSVLKGGTLCGNTTPIPCRLGWDRFEVYVRNSSFLYVCSREYVPSFFPQPLMFWSWPSALSSPSVFIWNGFNPFITAHVLCGSFIYIKSVLSPFRLAFFPGFVKRRCWFPQ